jgi:hypothetical protein
MALLKCNRYSRYPQSIGAGKECLGELVGPNPYTVGGDTVDHNAFLFNRFIEHISGGLSNSGTYIMRALKANAGPQTTWKIKIYVVATGAEAGAINLSAERFPVRVRGI